ncbi:DUF4258 domain-containing protein [Desulfonatronovibrio magnus]|uniref:DUF4258 domain-containing protein n=1 Tax=Desulfonatronovibrio magnus TaxID=698827 RepID=UPI0009FC1171|nr:DUF4258 domain-containing protein [Desulfonatronovibrio magnus]
MDSEKFGLEVQTTYHARKRMAERRISEELLKDIIETGQTRYKDETHLWISKHVEGRNDNLICAAVVLESKLVVKTIMHHFQWE